MTCWPMSGAARLTSIDVLRAVLSRLQGRARQQRPARAPRRMAGSASRPAADMLFQVPGAEIRERRQQDTGQAHSDPRRRRRPAGALFAQWRRRAGRPDRRHRHAGRGDHHLPDPVAGTDAVRRPAGALARRALGHRGRQWRALSGTGYASPPSTNPVRWPRSPRSLPSNDANIANLSMHRTAPDFMEMIFDLEVWDISHLTRIIRQLAAKPIVGKAERLIG